MSGKVYELVHENRNGWNAEAFRERYSEVLERYDYIIGDWGYSQLRLKGFFKDNHMKATKESTFSSLSDYINEYCNFGCAYFVLEKTGSVKKSTDDEEIEEDDSVVKLDIDYRRHASEEDATASLTEAVLAAAATASIDSGYKETSSEEQQSQSPKQRNSRHEHQHRRSYRQNGGERGKKPIRPAGGKDVAAGSEKVQANQARDNREHREAKAGGSREPREPKQSKEHREPRAPREPREPREHKEPRESKNSKDQGNQ